MKLITHRQGFRSLAGILIIIVLLSVFSACAQNNSETMEPLEPQTNPVAYPQGVSSEMSDPSWWAEMLGQDADRLLLSAAEIEAINQAIVAEPDTGVWDLTEISEDLTQAERKAYVIDIMEAEFRDMVGDDPADERELYVDGMLIENASWLEGLKNAVLTTGFENDEEIVQLYAAAVKRTEIKKFPIKGFLGYDSPDDPDDEACNTTLEVNEPFVIRAKCTVGDDVFFWGLSSSYTGWVNAAHLALFDTKQAWIDAWKVDVDGKDFLVVIQDSITLEPSTAAPETSEVQLKLGTVLKLVPSDEIPETVNGRSVWNNYVVYLPTRDAQGRYVKSLALISEHERISIGYLPLTQREVLNVAFSCLGDRYGWGGMLGAMDCSAFTKAVYKCFGLELPRDCDTQECVPDRIVSLEEMTEEEKAAYIAKLPAGTALYMPGHTMLYLGSVNGTNYVISAAGAFSEPEGEVDVKTVYSIVVSPITVRRRNGSTWLSNLSGALVFGK